MRKKRYFNALALSAPLGVLPIIDVLVGDGSVRRFGNDPAKRGTAYAANDVQF